MFDRAGRIARSQRMAPQPVPQTRRSRRTHVARVRYDAVMELTAAITHEDPWYVARCLEVEVVSQGETVDESLQNLREALELYFQDEDLPEMIEPTLIAKVTVSA